MNASTVQTHGRKQTQYRPQSKTAPLTRDEVLLIFAREVLKYEAAQLNIHFAFIGSVTPCPCDDCRNVEQYPAPFFLYARQVVRRSEWMNEQEKLAQEMLDAGKAQQVKVMGVKANPPLGQFVDTMADADLVQLQAEAVK